METQGEFESVPFAREGREDTLRSRNRRNYYFFIILILDHFFGASIKCFQGDL